MRAPVHLRRPVTALRSTTSGAEAAAIRPPAYGIAFADRAERVSSPDEPHEREAHRLSESFLGAHPSTTPRDLPAAFGRFAGHDLSGVRIHDDEQTDARARSLGTAAFTLGEDIGVARGRASVGVLAHELAHVVAQRSTPQPPGTLWRAPPTNDEEQHQQTATAGPPGQHVMTDTSTRDLEPRAPAGKIKASPGAELQTEVRAELARFKRADKLILWLEKRHVRNQTEAERLSTARGDVVRLHHAFTISQAELIPPHTHDALALLIEHDVLTRLSGPTLEVSIARGHVDRRSFDAARAKLEVLDHRYTNWRAVSDPTKPVSATRLIDFGLAGSYSAGFYDRDAAATASLGEAKQKLQSVEQARAEAKQASKQATADLASATPEQKDQAKLAVRKASKAEFALALARTKLADAEAKAKRTHKGVVNQDVARTLAASVADFLEHLNRHTAIKFTCGTYVDHLMGEFSVDVNLSQPPTRSVSLPVDDKGVPVWNKLGTPTATMRTFPNGFYDYDNVVRFFADLNSLAHDGLAPWGLFQWQATYNDPKVVDHVNSTYGKRCYTDAFHGPGPTYKLHIHLDVRPATLPLANTGLVRGTGGHLRPE